MPLAIVQALTGMALHRRTGALPSARVLMVFAQGLALVQSAARVKAHRCWGGNGARASIGLCAPACLPDAIGEPTSVRR